jgi:hypothetical protein
VSRRFIQRITSHVADKVLDRLIRNAQDRIDEIQDVAVLRGKIIRGVELPDAMSVTVPHGLGYRCSVFVSPVRDDPSASGRIEDVTAEQSADRREVVILYAAGWGQTVHVDVWCF